MKKEIIERLATLLTAAFGLVAALAWDEAIKSLFVEGGVLYFLSKGSSWLYAILVTILAVVATIWIARLSEKSK